MTLFNTPPAIHPSLPARPPWVAWLFGQVDEVDTYVFAVNWLLFCTAQMMLISAVKNYLCKLTGIVEFLIAYIIFLLLYFLHRFKKSKTSIILNLYIVLFFPVLAVGWFSSNGFHGGALFYFTAILVILFIFFHGFKCFILIFSFTFYLFILYYLELLHPEWVTYYSSKTIMFIDQLNSIFMSGGIICGCVLIFYNKLLLEKNSGDFLVQNVFPDKISQTAKSYPAKLATHIFESATILFTDIEGFTKISENLSAQEVAFLLNEVFSYMDTLVEKYGLEKIKTIGDCYILAGGISLEHENHAVMTTHLALEFLNTIKNSTYAGRRLSFRIGISSGPVLAGMVGKQKIIYDLWGDAVTYAERIEQLCPANNIYVTESTYKYLRHDFLCESADLVLIENVPVPIWRVLMPKSGVHSDPLISPPPADLVA